MLSLAVHPDRVSGASGSVGIVGMVLGMEIRGGMAFDFLAVADGL